MPLFLAPRTDISQERHAAIALSSTSLFQHVMNPRLKSQHKRRPSGAPISATACHEKAPTWSLKHRRLTMSELARDLKELLPSERHVRSPQPLSVDDAVPRR